MAKYKVSGFVYVEAENIAEAVEAIGDVSKEIKIVNVKEVE